MRLEYTAEEALGVLLSRIGERNPELLQDIQRALDAGKVEVLEQELPKRGKKAKSEKRQYRKARAMLPEEAIKVILSIIRAHTLELRKMINSADANFANCDLGVREFSRFEDKEHKVRKVPDSLGHGMLRVEIVSESALKTTDTSDELVVLETTSEQEIQRIEAEFARLTQFLAFGEDK